MHFLQAKGINYYMGHIERLHPYCACHPLARKEGKHAVNQHFLLYLTIFMAGPPSPPPPPPLPMKAHLFDTHLFVPRSRSSAKVKVKCQGNISQEWLFLGR